MPTEHDLVHKSLEHIKMYTSGFNSVNTSGPYTAFELTRGMSREEYATQMTREGNTEQMCGLFYQHLHNMDQILMLTLQHKQKHSPHLTEHLGCYHRLVSTFLLSIS